MSEYFPDITYQYKENWCKNPSTNKYLPFDFCIEKYKIIIELDGLQHFKYVKNWNNNPEEARLKDIYKMNRALENGYSVIRMLQEDVYYNKYTWKVPLILAIKKYPTPQIIYLCKNGEYDVYKQNIDLPDQTLLIEDEDDEENIDLS